MKAGDLALREAQLSDAAFAADLETALRPDEPRDPIVMKDHWRNPEDNTKIERFIGSPRSRRLTVPGITSSASI